MCKFSEAFVTLPYMSERSRLAICIRSRCFELAMSLRIICTVCGLNVLTLSFLVFVSVCESASVCVSLSVVCVAL